MENYPNALSTLEIPLESPAASPPAAAPVAEASPPAEKPDWKQWLAPLGLAVAGIVKFAAHLKVLAVVKVLLVILKTGGTMYLSIALHARRDGWAFATGFMVLILVHEMGHFFAARALGLKAGAPVFIPFLGAAVVLKDLPRNVWMESLVGIGGPALGAVGAMVCHLIYVTTGQPYWAGLAMAGYFVNLLNLVPVWPLDGGRIVGAVSPWLWLVGMGLLIWVLVLHPTNLLLIVLLLSMLPKVISLFRRKSEEDQLYYALTPRQRLTMGAGYFGLAAVITLAMHTVPVLQGAH